MATYNTKVSYSTDGVVASFTLPFSGGWVLASHIRATFTPLGGVATPIAISPANISGTFLNITPALPAGTLLLERSTPADVPIYDFTSQALERSALNAAIKQTLFAAGEAHDLAHEALDAIDQIVVASPALTVNALLSANSTGWPDSGPVTALGRTTSGDLGGGLFWFIRTSTITADNGLVFAPSGGGRLIRIGYTGTGFAGQVIPQWWGAVADGNPTTFEGTECSTAIAAALRTSSHVHLPPGFYKCSNTVGSQLVVTRDVVLTGAGPDASVILFNDTTNARRDLFASNNLGAWNVTFHGFAVRGSWGRTEWDQTVSHLCELVNVGNVNFSWLDFSYSRHMALVITGCADFVADNVRVSYTVADGIRATKYRTAAVSRCTFRFVNDDCVALHTSDSDTPLGTDTSALVTECTVIDSQGITALGARRLVITNNRLRRTHCRAIYVGGDATFEEGNVTPHAVVVTDNIIVDHMDALAFASVSGGMFAPITIQPPAVVPIAGVGVPGQPDGAGGIVQPWPYLLRNNVDETGGSMGVLNLTVHGNQVLRTLQPGSAYSAYGYGVRYGRLGPVDPVIAPEHLGLGRVNYPVIRVNGGAWNCDITGNVTACGYHTVVSIMDDPGAAGVRTFMNTRVVGNVFTQFTTLGLFADCDGRVTEDDNIWDADPYHTDTNRRPNGTWATGASSPVGVYTSQTAVVLLGSSQYRNLFAAANGPAGSIQPVGSPVVCCQPVDLGAHASNKGVGWPGAIPGSTFIVEDCDPASGTYGRLLNACPLSADAQPTTGTWVQGRFVKNERPAPLGSPGSRYIVTGWHRVTTGNAHVAGTDWVVATILTGT